jgi:hypothetical protein
MPSKFAPSWQTPERRHEFRRERQDFLGGA